jgi:triosephosphate isomerase
MRKTLIAGNWKMYHTPSSGACMLKELLPLIESTETEVLVCPPATDLSAAAEVLKPSPVFLGGQNLHWAAEGAYTGEISAAMLKDIGCSHVIIGHSERRQYNHETDADVSQKGQAAVAAGLIPIVCVGETEAQRQKGETLAVIKAQLEASLAFWSGTEKIVLAYEPVWAIGTGLTATADDAEAVIAEIRATVAELKGAAAAETVQILYGGSVKPGNIAELMAKPNIDGALVGGASLKAVDFAAIINYDK